jgi:DNA polymerase III alpha subunit
MVNLMKMNSNHQMVLTERDVIRSWLSDIRINKAQFEDIEPINIYNEWCNEYDSGSPINATLADNSDTYTENCINDWHMPDEYTDYNIRTHLENLCKTKEELTRVRYELELYEDRGLTIALNFLRYLERVCDDNDIVLGVGRGSSVSSYCLFLLGIHRVNSIKYELDIKEFLK